MNLGESWRAGQAPAAVIVLLGASGDLCKRLVVPALYRLAAFGGIDHATTLIGVDKSETTVAEWLQGLREAMADTERSDSDHGAGAFNEQAWKALTDDAVFISGDLTRPELYARLADAVGHAHPATRGRALFYLAVAPALVLPATSGLASAGLLTEAGGPFRRLIVEKPFGADVASAREVNLRLSSLAGDDQIYRIDHFMGKDAVRNVLALRFANGLFERVWHRDFVDQVQITVAETLGVEGRGAFYDGTGAIRDMIPNHLFQLVAVSAMEAPVSLSADDVRARKLESLQAIKPVAPGCLVRGQYAAANGSPGYRDENTVPDESNTETFAALRLAVQTDRWHDVPFYVRTGKRLRAQRTEIALRLRSPINQLFPRHGSPSGADEQWLVLELSPVDRMTLSFRTRRRGPAIELEDAAFAFQGDDWFLPSKANGYDTLLFDCLMGDATHFQSAAEVEAAWAVLEDVLTQPTVPATYGAGSSGPLKALEILLAGHQWRPILNTTEADHESAN